MAKATVEQKIVSMAAYFVLLSVLFRKKPMRKPEVSDLRKVVEEAVNQELCFTKSGLALTMVNGAMDHLVRWKYAQLLWDDILGKVFGESGEINREKASEVLERLKESLNDYSPLKPPIRIWPFDEAPKEYQELSTNGGDEDWVAFIPDWILKRFHGWIPVFLDEGSGFGYSHVQEVQVEGGVVLIGCHA